ncbi:hypothetical protein [Hansschlegelia zhihuaiae]|uniref:Class I SAM-dependent methyltransferase n=1 Tax=Hansschlegelia zhihuaiae TaxID=405005 RepID=A0A4Q0M2S8_9HYPH|nr:hypothetical protein [Hansschlegelia zhihuaiae]RXF67198.1 hypothetical protein EK403_21570 [Hansschlegelia zhihuaiae]
MAETINERLSGICEKIISDAKARGYDETQFVPEEMIAEWRERGQIGIHKYLNLDKRMLRAAKIAYEIGLDRTPGKISLLDLGAGPAYICVVARELGHDALALDIQHPLYEELCKFFNVPRVEHRITPSSFLPEGLGKFDYVSALAIKFHERKRTFWSHDEWDSFLKYMDENCLTPNGGLYFSFNYRTDHPVDETDEWQVRRRDMYVALHDWFLSRSFVSPEPGVYLRGSAVEMHRSVS